MTEVKPLFNSTHKVNDQSQKKRVSFFGNNGSCLLGVNLFSSMELRVRL